MVNSTSSNSAESSSDRVFGKHNAGIVSPLICERQEKSENAPESREGRPKERPSNDAWGVCWETLAPFRHLPYSIAGRRIRITYCAFCSDYFRLAVDHFFGVALILVNFSSTHGNQVLPSVEISAVYVSTVRSPDRTSVPLH